MGAFLRRGVKATARGLRMMSEVARSKAAYISQSEFGCVATKCEQHGLSWAALVEHVWHEHAKRINVCPLDSCGRLFSTWEGLRQHFGTHEDDARTLECGLEACDERCDDLAVGARPAAALTRHAQLLKAHVRELHLPLPSLSVACPVGGCTFVAKASKGGDRHANHRAWGLHVLLEHPRSRLVLALPDPPRVRKRKGKKK